MDGGRPQTAEFISSNTGTVSTSLALSGLAVRLAELTVTLVFGCQVDIIFVFYTPKYGITSVLSLMVDFTDPAGSIPRAVPAIPSTVSGDDTGSLVTRREVGCDAAAL